MRVLLGRGGRGGEEEELKVVLGSDDDDQRFGCIFILLSVEVKGFWDLKWSGDGIFEAPRESICGVHSSFDPT